ncbi:MAG: methylated-DNA--[protein]-cysteine S-methyltransferase [Gammaproteobacteria bacterium]|jgi:methylated-DNA-[protein]-cysteine S-methyltransferase|nr:methylated-DNA--[protein]-cysteine S-methyltransferase [Gammaproteobacteria bacterium]MDH5173140.1 methylated-DNA--[protein]-cysteine S-methyltransferase [Gammaproteobacteria bacterium]
MNYQYLDTPIGRLRLVSTGSGLSAIEFAGHHGEPGNGTAATDAVLERAGGQLLEYFAGRRRQFDLPLAPVGTPFQRAVWNALAAIPWGALRSYADIARAIERPTAVRAVGAANGRNPLPIVVPCHRVIGSNGTLTGFAGGLDIKRQLLELEGSWGELPF